MEFILTSPLLEKIKKRHQEITPALFILEKWTDDVLKNGLIHAIGKDVNVDEIAKQMIDSKAKGFETLLREIDWHGEIALIIEKISYISLLVKSLLHFENFSPQEQFDLVVYSGLDLRKDDVRNVSDIFFDDWLLVATEYFSERNSMEGRKSWFWGQNTNQYAYFLEYQHGSPLFPLDFKSGQTHHIGAFFYPSVLPERILIEKETINISENQIRLENSLVCTDYYEMQNLFCQKIGVWAWYENMPITIEVEKMRVGKKEEILLYDKKDNFIRLKSNFEEKWTFISYGFTVPFHVFGIWNGKFFVPLSVHKDNAWFFFGQTPKNNLSNR